MLLPEWRWQTTERQTCTGQPAIPGCLGESWDSLCSQYNYYLCPLHSLKRCSLGQQTVMVMQVSENLGFGGTLQTQFSLSMPQSVVSDPHLPPASLPPPSSFSSGSSPSQQHRLECLQCLSCLLTFISIVHFTLNILLYPIITSF